jgi:glycosyltransferase involved in cell wall biosynthesis
LKKLLFTSLNDHVPWGGSEVLWSEVAKHLVEYHVVTALVKKWDDLPDPIKQLGSSGVTISYKPQNKQQSFKQTLADKIKNKIGFKTQKPLHDLEALVSLNAFDLVIISLGDHASPKLISYTQFLKRCEIPFVIVIQLATDLRYLEDQLLFGLKESYQHAKAVCYLSEANLDIVETHIGAFLTNKIKIDNPFNYKQDYIAPIEHESYNIACVAALTTFHKGQDLLLKALAQDKWRLRNVCFNFYGGGINKNQLKSLVKLYNLENIVKFKGYEPDKSKIWKENIACVMPSRMEGQSLAMLEAMAYGRMVISTKVGDAQRLIKINKTGFLIDAPTAELIDNVLEKAWENRANWIDMGKLSRIRLYEMIKTDPVEDFSNKLLALLA